MTNRPLNLLGLILLFPMLGWMFFIAMASWDPAFGPDLRAVPLTRIESGKVRKSGFYAQVTGYADPRVAVVNEGGKTRRFLYYTPLRSTISSTAPVHLIVVCRESAVACTNQPNPRTIRGYVAVARLGASDRGGEQLAAQGVKLAQGVRTITSPERNSAQVLFLILVGFGAFLIFGLFDVKGWR